MSHGPDEQTRPWWRKPGVFGAVLVLGAFALSLYRVQSVQEELFDPNQTILRISHWQLELGYRDALAQVIREYEHLQAQRGKRVRVVQMPITEKVYPQVINTSLISGQAPDLIELGHSSVLQSETYMVRYFAPLTQATSHPNPYNAETDLADVPWRETFFDGMRGTYNLRLQDYFSVPTATFNQRIFYNKNLFREAGGSDVPPASFGQLMALCTRIRELGQRQGRVLAPIAGNRTTMEMFRNHYAAAFTASLEKDLDMDLDGQVTKQETYAAFATGRWNMQHPNVRAFYECLYVLCGQFARGFAGKDRQTAAFEFVQQRAAMIATGSWDANSLFEQAREAGFEIGIFDFPMPAAGEPFGQFIFGKQSEATNAAGAGFGLYKLSRNYEQALDFLQYLTCRAVNQRMMERASWIPAIIGAEPTGRMAAFAPDPVGFNTSLSPAYGSNVEQILSGQLQAYLQGEQSYDRFAATLEDALCNANYGGDRAWSMEHDEQLKQVRNQERVLAAQRMRELFLDDPDAPGKQRQILLQQIRTNNGETSKERFQKVRGFALPPT